MPWDANTEQLICHMLIDDDLCKKLELGGPEGAFWRAFIVRNRETGTVYAKFRYKHATGSSWHYVEPKDQVNDPAGSLQSGLKQSMELALPLMGASIEETDRAIKSFYPPDDEGHPERTIDWLIKEDLITIHSIGTLPEERWDGVQ